MKKSTIFYLVFFYVLLFFGIAPVMGQFFGERQEVVVACYPFLVFLNAGISFLIYTFSIKGRIFDKPIESAREPFFVYSANTLLCFGVLFVSSCVFEAISYFLKIGGGLQEVIFPTSFLGWMNFFFGVVCAAFFEEVIYRFYLPRAFREIFGKLKVFRNSGTAQKAEFKVSAAADNANEVLNRLWFSFLCEGLALLLFGLGHIYLGVLGFLNALVCGAALRLCMARTKSLWIPFAIHALYNFLSFLAVYLLF